MTLWLTTLGDARVGAGDGADLPPMAERSRLACLVFLGVEGVCARGTVEDVFWHGAPPTVAEQALDALLEEIHGALGRNWLEVRGNLLRVRPSLRVDAVAFRDAASEGGKAEALRLYRGHFLEGFVSGFPGFDRWADERRADFEQMHRKVRRASIESSVERGYMDAAIQDARTWADLDPLDDEAQSRLIELLAASGDRWGAIDQFDTYREALARDGLEPLEETVALVARIDAGEATGAPTSEGEAAGAAAAPAEPEGPEEEDPETKLFASPPITGPRLVRILEGGADGEAYALVGTEVRIGREQCDIAFVDDELMSPVHASIHLQGDASDQDAAALRFVLRDEESEHGVFIRLNGELQLQPGDMFSAGRQVFRFDKKPGVTTEGTRDLSGEGSSG
jgi:DNA-binding SARP family transcriptional activator